LSIPERLADISYKTPTRTLRLMHDGTSFDEMLPKQVGYFGTRINGKQP
jgi:hypothetical protein